MDNPAPGTGDSPLAAISAELAAPLRPYLEAAAEEMVLEIQGMVPEYARPLDSKYGRRMRWTVRETIRHFIDAIGRPDFDWSELAGIYARIGAHEARSGRNLDGLQTAIRVSGQVACRRFIKDAQRLNWSLQLLGQITESLFVFLERLAGAAAQGYAAAQEQVVTERERSRWRLRDLLVADPPASREAIAELARSAHWDLPRTLALVAVRPPLGQPPPVMPPSILADWHGSSPYLVVPDPDGPAQERLITSLVRDCAAAIGPTVPLTRGALSLRWARHALELVERGVIPEKGPVRCLDHIPTLVTAMSEEIIEVALAERLAPLMELPPHRREPLVRTLLTYMENRDNAVAAAERLLVHEQTVRYRIRRLEEMLGDALTDPDRRLEMLLLLHTWVHFGREPAAEEPPAPRPLSVRFA
ncbi:MULTISPECIES: PucR family transcriptional regulator [Thermomonospora]|uniref:Putative transcriptional regulator, PucR family n=1 Tax=Thermomonospora curvata (strain ATCC 19995 / DSM 43183 / JCM 3096 / KCTC 9072 / NBRC 15933 / NCIMB 10081 / Henssen B9) TaxID=471852 RepID=D1AD15_THECD|nr:MULTISPECIES: helix-turn-helix domain-containing protein [Thermomonospora]ACY99324.1 putative transcriptional regulator, PucR family [Thermomonospora curvata DSM 43183]PKK12377.1 MAG: PucR family transcriptional regulator [Thermomonospora sp. CIF 1]